MAGTRKTQRRSFGAVRRLPSGLFQARYTDPLSGERVSASTTFQARQDADAWLATRQADIIRGAWMPEARKTHTRTTFAEYAHDWLDRRDLKPSTRGEYRRILDKRLIPVFGGRPLAAITSEEVREWHAKTGRATPTERAHSYALLRTILGTAVTDDLIAANPCRVRGAGQAKRARNIRPATLDELRVIVEAMPPRWRVLVLLSTWTALRFGEATELRRRDVDLKAGVLRIRRGVTRANGGHVVGTPKSSAGSRDVAIPPHLLPMIAKHLEHHAQPGKDGLLFPAASGGHLAPSSLYGAWYPARHVAGRDDLRFHDLRHTGAVLAASTGATLAELMARLGHSTPAMAMRYQHAAADRDRDIAARLSQLAEG